MPGAGRRAPPPGSRAVIAALARRAARPALAAAALCGLTYLVLVPAWRYAPVATDLLAPGIGAAGEAGARPAWRANGRGVALARAGDTAVARISAAGRGGPVPLLSARLRLPAGTDAVRARVELKATGLEAGRDSWQQGRVQIYGHDARGGFVWYWPKDVATIAGTTRWRSFEAIVPAGAQVPYMRALIYNGGRAGLLEARGVRIVALRVRPVFAWLRGLVGLAWGALGLWAGWTLLAAPGRPAYRGATLAFAVVALAGTLTPQPQFGRLTAPIEAGLRDWLRPAPPAAEPRDRLPKSESTVATAGPAATPAESRATARARRGAGAGAGEGAGEGADAGADRGADDRSGPSARPPREPAAWSGPSLKQAGHFAIFTLLALAAFVAYGSVHPAAIAGYLLVFALATETMQLFLITRSARAMDLAVDGAGILLAWAALAALGALRAVARGRGGRAERAARDAGP